MSTFNRRLLRIEAATGDLPMTVKDMTDRQLIRFIFGGDGLQEITDAQLQQIIETGANNERD